MKKTMIVALIMTAGLMARVKDPVVQHQDSWVGTREETRIAKEVRHELLSLPYFGVFDDLGFNVNGSEVTLVGSVVRPTLKSDAEHVVRRIEGVTAVKNNIEVLPLSPNDDRIRMATFRAIYRDSTLGTRYGFQAVPSIHIKIGRASCRERV